MYSVQWQGPDATRWETEKQFEVLEEAIRWAMVEARFCAAVSHRVVRPKANGLPKVLVKFKPLGGEK